MATLILHIENMHCGSCVRTVTQTLNGLPDTHAEQVAVGRATVISTATAGEIAQALAAAGFPAKVETAGP